MPDLYIVVFFFFLIYVLHPFPSADNNCIQNIVGVKYALHHISHIKLYICIVLWKLTKKNMPIVLRQTKYIMKSKFVAQKKRILNDDIIHDKPLAYIPLTSLMRMLIEKCLWIIIFELSLCVYTYCILCTHRKKCRTVFWYWNIFFLINLYLIFELV